MRSTKGTVHLIHNPKIHKFLTPSLHNANVTQSHIYITHTFRNKKKSVFVPSKIFWDDTFVGFFFEKKKQNPHFDQKTYPTLIIIKSNVNEAPIHHNKERMKPSKLIIRIKHEALKTNHNKE
jgi:hypothetical protein